MQCATGLRYVPSILSHIIWASRGSFYPNRPVFDSPGCLEPDMALGYLLLVATMLALAACQRPSALPQASADSTYSDSAYRADLLTHVALDQAIRDTFSAELRASGTVPPPVLIRMLAIDSANLAWLAPHVEAAGLPTRAEVGVDGVKAAFLLIQHADHDPAFQARMLPLLDSAYARGEVTGQELAMLTDRVAKAAGRPQRYGTQATIADGRATLDPIEDSVRVDDRRASLGLPPLVQYKRILDSVYGQQRPAR